MTAMTTDATAETTADVGELEADVERKGAELEAVKSEVYAAPALTRELVAIQFRMVEYARMENPILCDAEELALAKADTAQAAYDMREAEGRLAVAQTAHKAAQRALEAGQAEQERAARVEVRRRSMPAETAAWEQALLEYRAADEAWREDVGDRLAENRANLASRVLQKAREAMRIEFGYWLYEGGKDPRA